MAAEPRYMKRKVRAGDIEADAADMAIIVHYDVEATVLGENGEPMESKESHNIKKIRLTSLNENSNIPQLAQDIVDKCKLIHPSKINHIEDLCYFLQARQGDANSYWRQQQKLNKDDMQMAVKMDGSATMDKLDEYIEMLYEDMDKKVKATGLLLMLMQDQDNVEALCENEPLMLALSRVLKDDIKKNVDLVTNILHFFWVVSKFSQFHSVIQHYQVGRVSLQVVEYETRRHKTWLTDFKEKERKAANASDQKAAQAQLAKDLKHLRKLERKQERLLFVSLHLLLNIGENVDVERKMRKKNIVEYLVAVLDRRNLELLILTVTFLKKLSVFIENKNEMAELGVIEKLSSLMDTNNLALIRAVLRLLFNLSFDAELRKQMVKFGMIPRLVDLLGEDEVQSIILCLLYQISIDEKHKSVFAFTNILPMVRNMIIQFPDQFIAGELMALAINLATNERNALALCEDNGLLNFFKRVMNTRDPLLMKMIRNISAHPGNMKFMFLDYVEVIVSLAQNATSPDFQVEALGVLSNLTIDNFNYEKLLSDFSLVEFISGLLTPGIEDDIMLEAIVFIGMVAIDRNAAPSIAESPIIPSLMNLMSAKQEDDEIVLQITYAFYYFVLHDETLAKLLQQPHAVAYMVDLLQDKNQEIRKLASAVLDVIVEHDQALAEQIRRKKYEAHNIEWLQIIDETGDQGDDGLVYGRYADDGEDDAWRQNLYLDNSALGAAAIGTYADGEVSDAFDDDDDNLFV